MQSRYLIGTDILGAGFDISSLLSSFGGAGQPGSFGSGTSANAAADAKAAEERRKAEERARADAKTKTILYAVVGVLGVGLLGTVGYLAVRKK